jgi:hypothetical protein
MSSSVLFASLFCLLVADVRMVLSGELLSTRSVENFLFDKMMEINMSMKKVLERLDKLESEKERQKSDNSRHDFFSLSITFTILL